MWGKDTHACHYAQTDPYGLCLDSAGLSEDTRHRFLFSPFWQLAVHITLKLLASRDLVEKQALAEDREKG